MINMIKGHLAVAKELGISITKAQAEEIALHDLKTSTCLKGAYTSYVVYKTSMSITGDIHILTKLYVPKEHRGKGYARELLDRCETPLVTSDTLKVVRP